MAVDLQVAEQRVHMAVELAAELVPQIHVQVVVVAVVDTLAVAVQTPLIQRHLQEQVVVVVQVLYLSQAQIPVEQVQPQETHQTLIEVARATEARKLLSTPTETQALTGELSFTF
jgi:hypothetical protein